MEARWVQRSRNKMKPPQEASPWPLSPSHPPQMAAMTRHVTIFTINLDSASFHRSNKPFGEGLSIHDCALALIEIRRKTEQ